MNLRKIIFMGVLLGSFLAAAPLYAAKGENSPADKSYFFQKRHEKMEEKIQAIYSQLNLTDEQKRRLQENKGAHRDKKKAMFERMRSYREALNKELMKSSLDMKKINEIQAQFKTLQSQMIDDRLISILEVRKILTPDQFVRFLSLMQKNKFGSSAKQ